MFTPKVVLLCLLGISLSGFSAEPDKRLEFFEKKIRPIFVEKCYSCHSQEAEKKKKLKGEFYIDIREGLIKGGESGPAILPGKPEKSLLMKTIRHEIVDMQMPPKKTKLTDAQIADVEKWIKDGAIDPRDGKAPEKHKKVINYDEARQFWSFRRLEEIAVPKVKNTAAVKNEIDNFIVQKLEEKGISPAPEASRGRLTRRIYMGLTGLAPTKTEIDEFEKGKDWNALVEKVLASPHFGERWGRHWLDLARFAESNGYAFDKDRNGAFHYRDFVIKAFNKDMPYDEFIKLQLAGDLTGNNSHEHLASTGFIASGPFTSQQTAKERERSRYEQLDDLISTLGSSMLGLSVGCARCHDHKFDPITAADYYNMITAFERTGFETVGIDLKPEIYAAAKKKFDTAHQPYLDRLKKYETGDLSKSSTAWMAKWQSNDLDRNILAKYLKKWETKNKPLAKKGGITQYPLKVTNTSASGKAVLKSGADGVFKLTGPNPQVNTYIVEGSVRSSGRLESIVLDVLTDPSLKAKGPGRAQNGNFVLSNFTAEINGQKVKFTKTLADFSQNGYPVANAVDKNLKSGWAISGGLGKNHTAVFKLEKPVEIKGDIYLKIVMDQQYGSSHTIGKFRLRALSNFPKTIKEIGAPRLPEHIGDILLKDTRTPEDSKELERYTVNSGKVSYTAGKWYHAAEKVKVDPTKVMETDFSSDQWKEQKWKDNANVNIPKGYAGRVLESIRDYPASLNLKVNGNVDVWLDGKLLLSRKKTNIKQLITHHFMLPKGKSLLLMKINNGKPTFNFALQSDLDHVVASLTSLKEINPQQQKKLNQWYGKYDSQWLEFNKQIDDHNKKAPKPNMTNFYRAKKNGKTYGRYDVYHLSRGNSDAKLERAKPGFMKLMVKAEKNDDYWLKKQDKMEPRIAFTNWITDHENGAGHLLARVIVNRLWKQHMGAGLVTTPSDFGKMGAKPTHPELLDWLALKLIKNNWSLKSIHRLILKSAVYRQGTAKDDSGLKNDLNNSLLWTHRKQRVEAEIIRDRLLQLSGDLNKKMFGKGTLNAQDPRRSVYLTVKRSKLIPFLQLFDAPDAIQGKAKRNETNSAPQSLTLMNSPFVRSMCEKFVKRIKANSDEELIEKYYWQILSRAPQNHELDYLKKFLANQTKLYKDDKAAKHKSLVDLSQLLVCCNEFVYID